MKIIKYPNLGIREKLFQRPMVDSEDLESRVAKILSTVKGNGDKALISYTKQFDGVELKGLKVEENEFLIAERVVSENLKEAINVAKKNIEKFHRCQNKAEEAVETMPGIVCWRRSVAIENVGLYIPSGSAPLFSTLLMLGIPARIAGCENIVVCSPPNKNGEIDPGVLYVANLLGIKKVFKVGGAQAIAAMAYGTETIPQVSKIFGPGNQYVTCAKQLICKDGIAIDMPAGPSELAVLADESCEPSYVAADLLSQAEHGTDSQVLLVSDSETVINEIIEEMNSQMELLPRKEIAEKALENSVAILVKKVNDGMEIINEYAPEHLIIVCKDEESLLDKVKNAGSVFIGTYSCESAGDYASGTNHTLPTNGNAKAWSGVSVESFQKKISFQKLTEQGLNNIAVAIEVMAEAEGLMAHKNAVSIRKKINAYV
jgi:histidinol dehydrogenase